MEAYAVIETGGKQYRVQKDDVLAVELLEGAEAGKPIELGRVLAFNRNGIPIGQVLLPGRDSGHNLASTSMAIRPGTNDLFIVTSDGTGGQGATIFHAKVFAQALQQ